MKHTLTLFLLLIFTTACKKEAPAYEVKLGVACFRCAVQYSHNGSVFVDSIGQDFPRDTVPHPFTPREYIITAMDGDEVVISAHALQPSSHTVMTYVWAEGRIQAHDGVTPVGPDSMKTSTARWMVTELDKWGEPK